MSDHPGLVDHYNIARAKDVGRSVELAQEPGQGDRGNAGCDLKFLGGPGAERSAGDDIAGRFEDLAGDGQRCSLAGAGFADDHVDSRTRAGEPPYHRGLLDREMLMVVQQSGDEAAFHSAVPLSAAAGDLEEGGLDIEELLVVWSPSPPRP